ncbi:MAG: RDD family protein [Acetobacteraceae bacterium]|nr:RDD family protein [Acetobacteraceae bacterium]
MSDWTQYYEYEMTRGVLIRRVFAWLLDLVLIGLLILALWFALVVFGFLTLGLGFPLLGLLPLVPFCYHLVSLLSPACATPGQQVLGLIVLRNDDLGRPTGIQAVISTVVFYLTLATSGLLLLIALFTIRKRTLHDLVSGLVVVRRQAWQALTPPVGSWNMPPYA